MRAHRRAICVPCLILLIILLSSIKLIAEMTPAEIMNARSPSVVVVSSFNENREETLGSGFIISSTGIILTNYHIISDATSIHIRLKDGRIYRYVQVLNYSPATDIAVLKIHSSGLDYAELHDSRSVKVGERIVVIGNPLGLEFSISDGLLSGFRQIENMTLLQLTAPISHGSSGSPIFNDNGQVIGIATWSIIDGQNTNFGIPINYARELLPSPFNPSAPSSFAIKSPNITGTLELSAVQIASGKEYGLQFAFPYDWSIVDERFARYQSLRVSPIENYFKYHIIVASTANFSDIEEFYSFIESMIRTNYFVASKYERVAYGKRRIEYTNAISYLLYEINNPYGTLENSAALLYILRDRNSYYSIMFVLPFRDYEQQMPFIKSLLEQIFFI